MKTTSRWAAYGLGVVLPLALIVVILGADSAEGPKTAYVGVLAVVPMLAAVFATPLLTGLVALITWLSAYAFGQIASDGNVAAQRVRLIIIALVGLAAIGAAYLRVRRERVLISALHEAADAERRREIAETDQLTGLPNRQGLAQRLQSFPDEQPVTLAIIDCDDLKSVNDVMGHLAGDEYLVAVSGRLSGGLSRRDVIARWGGDEFLVAQHLDLDAAIRTLERLSAAINGVPLAVSGQQVQASVSIGVTAWPPGASFDSVLAAADRALYSAKEAGGNRVVRAD